MTFVAEQFPALGKIDAGATVQALEAAKPDGIFNATFGGDLTVFVREGNTRGLFEKRKVASLLTGEPEYLDPLGEETPEGLDRHRLSGADQDARAQGVLRGLQDEVQRHPRLGSVVGFDTMKDIAGARQGRLHRHREAGRGHARPEVHHRFRPGDHRALDHQSTLGAWVGETDVKDGKGMMKDWNYATAPSTCPSEDEVKKLRPASA